MKTAAMVVHQGNTRTVSGGTYHILGATEELTEVDSPRVVAILPRGEAIRNFVYSGALDEVAKACSLTILSVFPSQDIWKLLQDRYGQAAELRDQSEQWLPRFVREILDMAHGRYLWSAAAKERWRLRDLEADTAARKARRWLKKILCYPFAHPKGLEILSTVECSLSHHWRTTDHYVHLLKELRPTLVFNGSHVHSRVALPVVHAARALGIPTTAFIFSWDNLTSQGRIIPPYDYYLVWNERLRDQLLAIYPSIRPERVFVTGTPQFDFHFRPEFYWTREEFCARVGADPTRPIVLYTTGMANHMPGEPRIVEGIATMLRDMTEFGPPQLLVRVYPKDQSGRFEDLKRRCPDVLFPAVPWEPAWLTPRIEDAYLLTNTLRHAAVGINVASTVSLELCMFDKPVINVGYNPPGVDVGPVEYRRYYEFDHYRPVVASGAVEVVYSQDDLRHTLVQMLQNPQRQAAQRKALIHQFFGNTLDGRSSSRVAKAIETIVSQHGTRR